MRMQRTFSMLVDNDLIEEFKEATAATHRSASCLVREFMREFILQHKEIIKSRSESTP